ncbi:accessory Sec system protein Asp2 [Actinobacillus pleuropneumoniae]|uniref:Capsular polysaccharide biosynthesis protein Cps18C n=1 Tax=Actinobacillus pleuropneumoniae serovar 18 TaxID=2138312 RepID=A0A2R4FYB1_ACTPL|nr:accessory Sec system protein Asp2 [Actinobacillus pleuropneumoniae]AVT42491.1 capsular polysaccharide biosynthesis protein Cps18C [Actinobacillus pleuropneumoniae serovar 18]AVT42502.1 capsular polysaccharide biosynthesis protein Cps18C [Actinobacillus pleuropneumoniae serovar 18]UKH17061.1 alpha/beta hydrolase [Actinobacillus pleuropneumoniae]
MNNTEVINGIKITYKYQKRKYDTKHVIFIFSGFGGERGITYDFENALAHCPAHIIWIQDSFENAPSYYWCINMDFSYEEAISKFIEHKLEELDLTVNNCTFAGFSKGGSAALYYAIKHNIDNIVITVPQMNVGSYVSNHWKRIAKHMMGNITEKNIHILDRKLITALENDSLTNRNVYLFSSESDIQYATEVKPYLDRFEKYQNFNLFMANSLLVTEHKLVTSYHVPLILGIFYSLAQGAIPHYGICTLSGDRTRGIVPEKPAPVTVLKRFKFSDKLFFPEGLAYMKGVPCAKYGDIQTKLIISNLQNKFIFNLAKDHKPNLTKELYNDSFVNYDKGWFCTLKYSGISLEEILPYKGTYQLSIHIFTKYYDAIANLIRNMKIWYLMKICTLSYSPKEMLLI